jgi:hypothetical protein
MYLKKEISISFFIITISASNLYMPMIWSYVFLLDFLIPFLCGPDLQCGFGILLLALYAKISEIFFKAKIDGAALLKANKVPSVVQCTLLRG